MKPVQSLMAAAAALFLVVSTISPAWALFDNKFEAELETEKVAVKLAR